MGIGKSHLFFRVVPGELGRVIIIQVISGEFGRVICY